MKLAQIRARALNCALIVFSGLVASCSNPPKPSIVVLEPNLERTATPLARMWESGEFDAVIDPETGAVSMLLIPRRAVLSVPEGVDLRTHASEHGMKVIRCDDDKPTVEYTSAHAKKHLEPRQTTPDASTRIGMGRMAVVELEPRRADTRALEAYLAKAEASGIGVSNTRTLETLSTIAVHQLRYAPQGFGLSLDPVLLTTDLLRAPSEDPSSYDPNTTSAVTSAGNPLSDPYFGDLTNAGRAWRLAQALEPRFEQQPVDTANDVPSSADTGAPDQPILAIVDQGFAMSSPGLRPDIWVDFGDPMGTPAPTLPDINGDPWHGTISASVAHAFVNDGRAVAGSMPLASPNAGANPFFESLGGARIRTVWVNMGFDAASQPKSSTLSDYYLPAWLFPIAPPRILHSWVEVEWRGEWVPLEGFILDGAYLSALQRRFPDAETFCGYGAATTNLQDPKVEWCGKPTYIQKEGIAEDFGAFDHPDDLYASRGTNLKGLRRLLYVYVFRHAMNATVSRIRGGSPRRLASSPRDGAPSLP